MASPRKMIRLTIAGCCFSIMLGYVVLSAMFDRRDSREAPAVLLPPSSNDVAVGPSTTSQGSGAMPLPSSQGTAAFYHLLKSTDLTAEPFYGPTTQPVRAYRLRAHGDRIDVR